MYTQDLIFGLLLVSVLFGLISPSPPCHVYGCPHYYLPAPPGKTPPCAKRGQTYCENIDHYPTHVIQYLVERWQYDYHSLFSSERKDNINLRTVYGPPPPFTQTGYQFGQKIQTPSFFDRPPSIKSIAHNFNQTDEGYPDRRYPLGNPNLHVLSDDPGFIYSALLQPGLAADVTHYDPDSWWKRYRRSTRTKRQTNTLSLCPTTSQFIMPRAALNNKGNWMFVVNLDQDRRYTQLVRSETCISNECNGICSLPNGYTSKCQQQFVQKRLVALDRGGDNLYTDLFWLPHCCICQITQNIR